MKGNGGLNVGRLTERDEHGRAFMRKLPYDISIDFGKNAKYQGGVIDKLAAHEDAEEYDYCGNCRFKLKSESWKYYTYPCNECKHRGADHFAEAALQANGDAS